MVAINNKLVHKVALPPLNQVCYTSLGRPRHVLNCDRQLLSPMPKILYRALLIQLSSTRMLVADRDNASVA